MDNHGSDLLASALQGSNSKIKTVLLQIKENALQNKQGDKIEIKVSELIQLLSMNYSSEIQMIAKQIFIQLQKRKKKSNITRQACQFIQNRVSQVLAERKKEISSKGYAVAELSMMDISKMISYLYNSLHSVKTQKPVNNMKWVTDCVSDVIISLNNALKECAVLPMLLLEKNKDKLSLDDLIKQIKSSVDTTQFKKDYSDNLKLYTNIQKSYKKNYENYKIMVLFYKKLIHETNEEKKSKILQDLSYKLKNENVMINDDVFNMMEPIYKYIYSLTKNKNQKAIEIYNYLSQFNSNGKVMSKIRFDSDDDISSGSDEESKKRKMIQNNEPNKKRKLNPKCKEQRNYEDRTKQGKKIEITHGQKKPRASMTHDGRPMSITYSMKKQTDSFFSTNNGESKKEKLTSDIFANESDDSDISLDEKSKKKNGTKKTRDRKRSITNKREALNTNENSTRKKSFSVESIPTKRNMEIMGNNDVTRAVRKEKREQSKTILNSEHKKKSKKKNKTQQILLEKLCLAFRENNETNLKIYLKALIKDEKFLKLKENGIETQCVQKLLSHDNVEIKDLAQQLSKKWNSL